MKRDEFFDMYRTEYYLFCEAYEPKLVSLSVEAIDAWHADLKGRGLSEKDIRVRLSVAERLYNEVHHRVDLDFDQMKGRPLG